MTQESREILNRASGILEGISATEDISSAFEVLIVNVVEMIDEVLKKEEKK